MTIPALPSTSLPAEVQLKDVDLRAGTLTVKRGKGNQERRLALLGGTAQAMQDWMAVRGTWPGALLCRFWKHQHMCFEPISFRSVGMLVQARMKRAGLAPMPSAELDQALRDLQDRLGEVAFVLGVLVELRARAGRLQGALREDLARLIELSARVRDLLGTGGSQLGPGGDRAP